MKIETNPIKMKEMERAARQLIGTLKPNKQEPYGGLFILFGGLFIAIAIIKALIDPSSIEDVWDGIALIGLFFLLIGLFRAVQILSLKIIFDGDGIQTIRWAIGAKRIFKWEDIISCKQIWMGIKFETSKGDSIKFPNKGSFATNLYTSYKIFENRYSLEKE